MTSTCGSRVNTGEALVSLDASPGEGEAMVAGRRRSTPPPASSRLRRSTGSSSASRRTGRPSVRSSYREADAIEAKGKADRVPVWEALEARSSFGVDLGGAGRAALDRTRSGARSPRRRLTRARRERSTQLVTLVGVPGIGKSRLVYELGRVVDADAELITWRQGRCLPYGEGVCVLGARRDRQGAGRHPRVGYGRGGRGKA